MRYVILASVIFAALSLLAAPPTYTINGQVQDNTGKAAGGVRVCAIAEDFDSNPQPFRMTNNPPTSGIVNTTYDFQFVGAQSGRWRVWALDKEGREGFKSAWRVFVYLR